MSQATVGMSPEGTQAPKPKLANPRVHRFDKRFPNEVGGDFRIVVGTHFGDGPPGCDCDACATSGGKNHVYRARQTRQWKNGNMIHPADPEDWDGDIIRNSPIDLERRHNKGDYSIKFVRLGAHNGGQVAPVQLPPPEPYPLEKMTVPQLLAHAEAEEVDLKGAKSKEEMVKALRAAGK